MPKIFFESCPEEALLVAGTPIHSNFKLKPPTRIYNERDISLISPHPHYWVPLRNLREAEPLRHGVFIGWRFIQVATPSLPLGARLIIERNNEYRFLEFNIGPFVESTIDAYFAALNILGDGVFAFRFLLIPEIHLAAIWLHGKGDDGHQDLLIPLPTSPNDSEYRAYPAQVLFGRMARDIELAQFSCPPPRRGFE